jgi:hypothetical protein
MLLACETMTTFLGPWQGESESFACFLGSTKVPSLQK